MLLVSSVPTHTVRMNSNVKKDGPPGSCRYSSLSYIRDFKLKCQQFRVTSESECAWCAPKLDNCLSLSALEARLGKESWRFIPSCGILVWSTQRREFPCLEGVLNLFLASEATVQGKKRKTCPN